MPALGCRPAHAPESRDQTAWPPAKALMSTSECGCSHRGLTLDSSHWRGLHPRRRFLGIGAKASLVAVLPSIWRHALAADEAGKDSKAPSARLVLLGTAGGPTVRLDRAAPASALIINGEPYLIDCGEGTVIQLERAGIRHTTVGKVFLTHHHDDHNAGVGPLLSLSWSNGRRASVEVYGPAGTEGIVAATLEYAKANIAIRTLDEGRQLVPSKLWHGHDVLKPGSVFEDPNVRITCVQNNHFDVPGHQSLSYRFETPTRAVVFSGDTNYSEALIELAKGADVLVHEALQVPATRPILQGILEKQGLPQAEIDSLVTHILTGHASTEDIGRVASAAGVRLLVLNHLIPGGLEKTPLSDNDYITGVRLNYSGPIIVGQSI